jgi:glucokinase
VLGGGISKGLKGYLGQLEDINYLRPYKKYKVKIAISTLEEEAGILGAAALVKNKAIHAI